MKKILATTFAACALFSSPFVMADGAALYQQCVECHGEGAEKAALNQSAVIKGWPAEKTLAALQGYRDGTYGGPMKGLMTSKVSSFDDAALKALADHIAGL